MGAPQNTPVPIAAIVAVFTDHNPKVVGQVVIRRDGSIAHFGDESACVDALALIVRATTAHAALRPPRDRGSFLSPE